MWETKQDEKKNKQTKSPSIHKAHSNGEDTIEKTRYTVLTTMEKNTAGYGK